MYRSRWPRFWCLFEMGLRTNRNNFMIKPVIMPLQALELENVCVPIHKALLMSLFEGTIIEWYQSYSICTRSRTYILTISKQAIN